MRNCSASVVLPTPGLPSTRYRHSRGNPPPRTLSSPGTPVAHFALKFPISFLLPPRRYHRGPCVAAFRIVRLSALPGAVCDMAHSKVPICALAHKGSADPDIGFPHAPTAAPRGPAAAPARRPGYDRRMNKTRLAAIARNAMQERGLEPDFPPAAMAELDAISGAARDASLRD